MTHGFDEDYWEQHWQERHANGPESTEAGVANPYLARETSSLVPGTALDAGCGGGAESIWLALNGWQVTAADISTSALARAADNAATSGVSERIEWVEADLSDWEPGSQFDLVMTHYAHPAMPQLAFYERIAEWVAPGGTLLIVGHLHTSETTDHDHDDQPPAKATATVEGITTALDDAVWEIVTAKEHVRTPAGRDRAAPLHDLVVRATRRS